MRHEWVTNIQKSEAEKHIKKLESDTGKVHFISGPRVTEYCSVEQLKKSNLVGIYVGTSKCQECKGTGVITLFTSSSMCQCVKKNNKIKSGYSDYDEIVYLEP